MALLGSLAVNLIANTGKFDKKLKGSRKELKDFGGAARKVEKQLIGLAAGFASVETARLFVNQVGLIAQNVRFAQTLGLTTQQLEGYQGAASKLGASQEVMNDALLELSKRSAEAATGVGSMFDVMQLMNLDVEKFNRLSLDQKFELINDELMKIKDTAKRNFFADEIFGGASDEIGGLLPQITALANEFERTGLGTSAKGAENILKLDNSIKELTAKATRLGTQFVIDVSPAASRALDQASTILGIGGRAVGAIGGAAGAQQAAGGAVTAATGATRQAGASFVQKLQNDFLRGAISAIAGPLIGNPLLDTAIGEGDIF